MMHHSRDRVVLLVLVILLPLGFVSAQRFNVGVSDLTTFTPKAYFMDLHSDININTSLVGVKFGAENVKPEHWYSGLYVGQRKVFDDKFSVIGTIGLGYMSPFESHEKGSMYGELGVALRYVVAPPLYFEVGYNAYQLPAKERPNYQGAKFTIGITF